MSAQHTPGRVKVQHPDAGERGWEVAFEPGLERLCADITEANARRLVAAWNACEGIDTEYLEGDDSLPHYARRLMAQRDELLAALREMLAIVNDSRGVAGYHLNGNPAEWDEFDEVDAARAIIAAYEQKNGIGGQS